VLLHYLANHENRIFSVKCVTAFPEFNQSLLDFSSFVEMHEINAAIDSLNLVINRFQLWPVGAIAQEKWSWEFYAAAVELLCTPCTGACMSCVAERQIILSSMYLITVNICWDSKISYQYCPLTFHFRLDKEQLSLFSAFCSQVVQKH